MAVKIQKFKMVDMRLDNPGLARMSSEKNRHSSFENWPFEDEGQTDICTAKKVTYKDLPI